MLSASVAWVAASVVAIIVAVWVRPPSRLLLALVALAHLALVVSVAVFPIPVDGDLIEPARRAGWTGFGVTSVDLTPFETIRRSVRSGVGSYQFTQALQNLLVLSPIGLYAPMLWRRLRSWATFLPVAIVAGCSVEAVQLGVSLVLGFPYRSIDVDDVILNTAGVILAFALYWLALQLTRRRPSSGAVPVGLDD
jgi:glycopeptide antibiotics resistance protein